MITPKATHLILEHLDSVDEAVAKRMIRSRPWSEPALTSALCDLLDQCTQPQEQVRYSLAELNRDLAALDGLLDVSFTVETHEYEPQVERWVTQSDIGFVVKYVDHLLPRESWSASWLLQAKRLYPTKRSPLTYTELSRFGAVDVAQRERMKRLADAVGVPFLLYLLYCPRPASLDAALQQKLRHLRNRALVPQIFDYVLGLELHEALDRSPSSLAAGLFVVSQDSLPGTLGALHSSIPHPSCPLSWFLVGHFFAGSFPHEIRRRDGDRLTPDMPPHSRRPGSSRPASTPSAGEAWATGIVTGDPDAARRAVAVFDGDNTSPFPFLPPHTLTVEIRVGHNLDSETRRIRLE